MSCLSMTPVLSEAAGDFISGEMLLTRPGINFQYLYPSKNGQEMQTVSTA